jgi:hypothetical protein
VKATFIYITELEENTAQDSFKIEPNTAYQTELARGLKFTLENRQAETVYVKMSPFSLEQLTTLALAGR